MCVIAVAVRQQRWRHQQQLCVALHKINFAPQKLKLNQQRFRINQKLYKLVVSLRYIFNEYVCNLYSWKSKHFHFYIFLFIYSACNSTIFATEIVQMNLETLLDYWFSNFSVRFLHSSFGFYFFNTFFCVLCVC